MRETSEVEQVNILFVQLWVTVLNVASSISHQKKMLLFSNVYFNPNLEMKTYWFWASE